MNDYMLEELAETIAKELPVDHNDVLRILHRYWTDKIAPVWHRSRMAGEGPLPTRMPMMEDRTHPGITGRLQLWVSRIAQLAIRGRPHLLIAHHVITIPLSGLLHGAIAAILVT